MGNVARVAPGSGTKARRRSPPALPIEPIRRLALRWGAGVLLAAGLASAADAQVPGVPSDEGDRAWYMSFMARFNARVLPSFEVDAELESRLARAWDALVVRLTGGKGPGPSPLDQYPVLGFVDDRFVVMRYVTPAGKESFVVRSDALLELPTLSSTLASYLDETIYPSLEGIAREEKEKIARYPEYQPRLTQLSAHNPYQHGLPIRVPAMGPFKNRVVAFSGPGGRLSEADVAEYERQKWLAGSRQVTGVMRPQRWGVAVEVADLVEEGAVVCRYRVTREVAAVEDHFVGEGRRGVLVRRPRLGSVLEVQGCLQGCDQAAGWVRIYPEQASERPSPRARPRLPPIAEGLAPELAGNGDPFGS